MQVERVSWSTWLECDRSVFKKGGVANHLGGGSKDSLPIFVGVLLCCGVRQCLLNNGGVVALLENSSKFLGNILLFYY